MGHDVVGPATQRVESPPQHSVRYRSAPRRMIAILAKAGLGIGDPAGILVGVRVQPNSVDALRDELSAERIDQPKAIPLFLDPKEFRWVESRSRQCRPTLFGDTPAHRARFRILSAVRTCPSLRADPSKWALRQVKGDRSSRNRQAATSSRRTNLDRARGGFAGIRSSRDRSAAVALIAAIPAAVTAICIDKAFETSVRTACAAKATSTPRQYMTSECSPHWTSGRAAARFKDGVVARHDTIANEGEREKMDEPDEIEVSLVDWVKPVAERRREGDQCPRFSTSARSASDRARKAEAGTVSAQGFQTGRKLRLHRAPPDADLHREAANAAD